MSNMKQYHDLVQRVIDKGIDVFNERTQTLCKTVIGCQMEFDMSEGFPALTTRKLPFKSIVGELIGFFRGYQSAEQFRSVGCKFWDGNANETKAWLENPFRKGEDDVGRIYGAQWTNWESIKLVEDSPENQTKIDFLYSKGYNNIGSYFTAADVKFDLPNKLILKKNINQLEEAVRKIITNPSDRRIIVSGWNIGEFDMMSLPPCHIQYNFIPIEKTKKMSVVMTIRSMDLFLGTPANIASTALFLAVMCRLTGYTPDQVIIQGANAHLYENSFDAAKELMTREHFDSPVLHFSNRIKQIDDLADIHGCFEQIQPEDFNLINYQSHGPLTVAMIA